MTITAPAPTTSGIENTFDSYGIAASEIDALTPDQLQQAYAIFEQVSTDERDAFASYVSGNLANLNQAHLTKFRDHYVGSYTTARHFVDAYARARWVTPMEHADSLAALDNRHSDLLAFIDDTKLAEDLFYDSRAPYTFLIGIRADHIFTTDVAMPIQPRLPL